VALDRDDDRGAVETDGRGRSRRERALVYLREPGPDLDSVPDRAFELDDELADLWDPTPPLVYACHPKSTYGTSWAAAHLARLVELLPGAEVIDPERCGWETSAEWREDWPRLLDRLSGLVVFEAPDRSVGAGCLVELADALASGLPVAALDPGTDPERGLWELAGFELLPDFERAPARAARLRYGVPLPSLFA
jgi:hypothetical protein